MKYLRSAISPYGVLAPSDLKAEPRFAHAQFNLGALTREPLADLLTDLPDRFVPDACAQCMPSYRTGNSATDKLLADLRNDWPLHRQPFAATITTGPANADAP